jgi:hypothetical protein
MGKTKEIGSEPICITKIGSKAGAGDPTPEVRYIDGLTGVLNPAYKEGRLFYDNDKKCWAFYNDRTAVSMQIGRELWCRSCNNTGVQIVNGRVVYISGVDTGCPEISLAQPDEYNKSRIIGVVTENIDHGSQGETTSYGLVNNINTAGLSTGDVFLDHDGVITNTKPTGSHYVILIGTCLVVDASNGVIFVNPVITDTTVEVTDTNGIPTQWRTGTTMSFSDSSPDRTFTIAPTGTHFHYYINGDNYMVESSDTVQIDNTEGLHVIYYDNTTLTALASPSSAQIDEIIRTKCLVAYIYWDLDNSVHTYFADERHSISMSPETHSYLHFTRGAQFLQGLGLGDILSTVGLPIYYLDGATGKMRRILESGFSVLTDNTAGVDTTGRLVWNEWTGATWQLSVVTSTDYVLCHVFAVNGYTGQDQQIAVVGQATYGNIIAARAGAAVEISSILSGFPFEEIVPIATLIFQTSNGYGNDVKARVRSSEDGNYVDWRVTELAQGITASAHPNLTNLDYVGSGHIGFQRDAYKTTTNPTANNDNVDTAGIGRVFNEGDHWVNTSDDGIFVCKDATATAALWDEIGNAYIKTGNAFGSDVVLGLTDGYNLSIKTNDVTRLFLGSDGKASLGNELLPDTDPGGLCLNQNQNDNNIFTLKSTGDVAHGMTTQDETDTYLSIKKFSGNQGGIRLATYSLIQQMKHLYIF